MRRLGLLTVIVILALLAAGGYTAYAGAAVYQDLDGGRQALVAAQASMTAAASTGDAAQLQDAAAQLKVAERHFSDAQARSSGDPALRVVGGLPGGGGGGGGRDPGGWAEAEIRRPDADRGRPPGRAPRSSGDCEDLQRLDPGDQPAAPRRSSRASPGRHDRAGRAIEGCL